MRSSEATSPDGIAARGHPRITFWATRLAGPALVVSGSLIVLHGFWLAPRLTHQHPDLLPFWLPRWCFLASSVSSGHIPTWLPNQFAGVPFASDPQSGWLYLPPMLLFSTFSCARALGLVIVLNPILAGVGLYVFGRHEGLGRPAATVGALTLSLTIAGSVVALSMPFAATLAWTAVSLAGVSGYLHARTPTRLILWLGFSAFALSQVAAAHLTDGLLLAMIVSSLYLIARLLSQIRSRERRLVGALLMAVGLPVASALLAAAIWIPHLTLLHRTPIGQGYVKMSQLTAQLSGHPASPPLVARGASPWWATAFARSPGGYVGVLAIVLFPLGLASRKWRLQSIGFALAGFLGWLLNLDWLVRRGAVRKFALKLGVGEVWLRSPFRFRYLLIIAFAALASYGTQAWLDRSHVDIRRGMLTCAVWLLPPLFLLGVLPLLAGSARKPYLELAAGSVVALPILFFALRSRSWALVALPVFVAVELTTAGVIGQLPVGQALAAPTGREGRFRPAFGTIQRPDIDPSSYLTPGAIGRTLIGARKDFGRYLAFDPKITKQTRGWTTRQSSRTWPAYENGRSILFGIYEIQGYSPVQLDRYWRFVRKADPVPIFFNAATFQVVRPEVLRLFGVEWLILPTDLQLPEPASAVATEGDFTLYRLASTEPRASVVFQWSVAPAAEALTMVLKPGFDPDRQAILEVKPTPGGGISSSGRTETGSASYEELTPEHARIHADATSQGILLVRNVFDKNWQASLDGRRVPLLVTDYLMQGVVIPPGNHVVDLTYHDRAIGVGLMISAAACALLIALLAASLLWSRSLERGPAEKAPGDARR